MADLNRVTLVGRLTKDADLKYTQAGLAISNFSIAVNRRRRDGEQWVEEASFFEIRLYGKTAEALKPYLIKGKQVAVDGELRQERWEQDGQPRSKVVVVANSVQLLGGNAGGGGDVPAGGYSQPTRGSYQPRMQEPPVPYGGGNDFFPEDILF